MAIHQPDLRTEAKLVDALGGAHQVLLRPNWHALVEAVRRGEVDACLVDANHPDRSSASRRIATLRRDFVNLAILACLESDGPEEYFDLGGLGVDGLVVPDDGGKKIRLDVNRALSRARALQAQRILADRAPAPVPEAVAWAVEHAGPDASVHRLAAAMGHTPTTLRRLLHNAGFPPPARVLLWGRLIAAGARLAEGGRTVEDVAFSLGYATATSLARAMKVHGGYTPAEVARDDGMRMVLDALVPPDGERSEPSGSGGLRALMLRAGFFSLAVVMAGCATLGLGGGGVDKGAVERVLSTPPIDQLHVGVLVVDGASGRTLLEHNAHRKFVPASNQKILVTAAALSLLGPDFRFRTEVWATGSRYGSVLDGDLVLLASGDPSMSGRYWTSGTHALEALADSIRAAGVDYVAGSVYVDVSAWDSTTVGPTREVEDLRYAYGSTGGAFTIDEGELRAVIRAGPSIGSRAIVDWTPTGAEQFVDARLLTAGADSAARLRPRYLPESRRIVLEGVVPRGAADTTRFAARDPVRQASAAWWRALQRRGVEVEGGWAVKWTEGQPVGRGCRAGSVAECERSSRLAAIESPPLAELAAGILGPSQNWMTEQLVRTLGARLGGEGSWEGGIRVIERFIVDEVGVDSLDVELRDGSGLSAYNLVTPRALVRTLAYMRDGPNGAPFRTAMAEPGEEASTLEERLTELEGRLFAKTGTISNVNSLSGYLVRDDGSEAVFSILTNGSGLPSSPVREAIDQMIRTLAR